MSKVITIEEENKICEYFKSKPMTLENLHSKFDYCKPTLAKILDKYNIKRYKKAQVYSPNLKENYFENIDNQNKAYFIGLIISDGNVFSTDSGNRQSSISITLQDSDSYMLNNFKNELCSNTSVNPDGRGSSTIAIRSNKMADDLKNMGIFERKSFDTYLPFLDKTLMPHLIRGILDGDGSVQAKQTNVRNRYKHSVGFCGTETLMNQIKNHLIDEIGVSNVKVYRYKDRVLSMVTWSSTTDVQKMYHYFYDNAIFYLYRKRQKFEEILKHYDLD